MIAFKGFTKNLTATWGKGVFQFKEGETYTEEESKCFHTGFHCAEDPFDCFCYYSPGSGNRYFMVEAAGSLNEDGSDSKIACTQITLLKELTMKEMAYHKIRYMILHPARKWQVSKNNYEILKDMAKGKGKNTIAIARGKNPKVKGKAGSILGLLCEQEEGVFEQAKVFEVKDDIKPDTWYRLVDGKLQEAEDEEKESVGNSTE